MDLHATGDGDGLYRSLGFTAPRHPALQLRRDQMPRPGSPAAP
ncbi:hypothetical protein [Actinoplanes sp. RD1]|nr:hypothetical protein [Actinoplanes sp. RD1]